MSVRLMCVAHLESAFHDLPQLSAHSITGVLNLEVSSLRNDLLSSEWTLGISPSRVFPPLLHSFDILLVFLVFLVHGDVERRQRKERLLRLKGSVVKYPVSKIKFSRHRLQNDVKYSNCEESAVRGVVNYNIHKHFRIGPGSPRTKGKQPNCGSARRMDDHILTEARPMELVHKVTAIQPCGG